MKKAYKELKKKLKNEFIKKGSGQNYEISGSVGLWVTQCGIKATSDHTNIICTIFGSVPYPYQENNRKFILHFLRENKYKDFKRERLTK